MDHNEFLFDSSINVAIIFAGQHYGNINAGMHGKSEANFPQDRMTRQFPVSFNGMSKFKQEYRQ